MPLSEEELRLLEQMERALVEEDPKFASTLRGTTMRRAARQRAVLAGVAFVAGVAILMGGAVTSLWWVGILGFMLMLGSATLGLSALRGQQQVGRDTADEAATTRHPSGFGVIDGGRKGRGHRHHKQRGSGNFMERMEERWRRRRERGF